MLSRFRVYLHLFLNEASSHLAYRLNTFLGMVSRIVFIFVQFAIWRALYGGRDAVQTGFGSVSLREMTTYVTLTTVLYFLIEADVIDRIDQRIKNGEIAIDFIRPISHLLSHLAAVWGQKLYGIAVQLMPMLVLVAAVIGVQPPPTVKAGLLALALVPGASLLLFLISYVLGLVGFWHSSVWQLGALLYMLISLFSGSFIPLWFFPAWLVAVAEYLPFRLLFFAPAATWLGKIPAADAAWLIAWQWAWIAGMLLLQRLLWLAGIRKVVGHGG
ncbi:MAG: ABC-2 family transporter protein [Spirochaetaceae bacterium]|nr:ABC-2 family transporter protein [Spirochaetaceae bacterium]